MKSSKGFRYIIYYGIFALILWIASWNPALSISLSTKPLLNPKWINRPLFSLLLRDYSSIRSKYLHLILKCCLLSLSQLFMLVTGRCRFLWSFSYIDDTHEHVCFILCEIPRPSGIDTISVPWSDSWPWRNLPWPAFSYSLWTSPPNVPQERYVSDLIRSLFCFRYSESDVITGTCHVDIF